MVIQTTTNNHAVDGVTVDALLLSPVGELGGGSEETTGDIVREAFRGAGPVVGVLVS